MPGKQKNADPVRSGNLTPVDRYVLDSRLRIPRDQQRSRDVRPAVVLVVFRNRQKLEEINVVMDDFLRGGILYLSPWQRPLYGLLKPRQEILGRHADRIRDPTSIDKQIGNDSHRVAARPREHHSTLKLELLGYRCKFVDQRDAVSRHRQPARRGEMLQPASQIGRRIVACRRGGNLCVLHRESSRLLPIRSAALPQDGAGNPPARPSDALHQRRYRRDRGRGRRCDRPYLRAYPAWRRRREREAR
jgi:hypothetical protein